MSIYYNYDENNNFLFIIIYKYWLKLYKNLHII